MTEKMILSENDPVTREELAAMPNCEKWKLENPLKFKIIEDLDREERDRTKALPVAQVQAKAKFDPQDWESYLKGSFQDRARWSRANPETMKQFVERAKRAVVGSRI